MLELSLVNQTYINIMILSSRPVGFNILRKSSLPCKPFPVYGLTRGEVQLERQFDLNKCQYASL